MIICLVGKSGSGKDTIARLLQKWYSLKPVCSYTSRPKREGEIEGREHHFITRAEAEHVLATRSAEVVAQTEISGNLYFALKEDLEKADMYVIDPKGIEYIQANFPEIELYQLYVYCDDNVAVRRVQKRGDDLEVYKARHASENRMFNTYFSEHKYDKLIDNSVTEEKMIVKLMEIMDEVLGI